MSPGSHRQLHTLCVERSEGAAQVLWHQCMSQLSAKVEQVFPTSGGRSSSLWDVASIPLLLEWLDQHMDASTANEVFEVRFLYRVWECAAAGLKACSRNASTAFSSCPT